jgi:hypothetical protein
MKKLFLLVGLIAGVVAYGLPAQANIISYGLDYEFSGATPPESSTPGGTAQPVPEPATMLLLGIGLIGLAVVSRRKFKKS